MAANTDGIGECSMPIGLAMSLSTAPAALTAFCAMDNETQDKIIAEARSVKTKREMEALVRSMTAKA